MRKKIQKKGKIPNLFTMNSSSSILWYIHRHYVVGILRYGVKPKTINRTIVYIRTYTNGLNTTYVVFTLYNYINTVDATDLYTYENTYIKICN